MALKEDQAFEGVLLPASTPSPRKAGAASDCCSHYGYFPYTRYVSGWSIHHPLSEGMGKSTSPRRQGKARTELGYQGSAVALWLSLGFFLLLLFIFFIVTPLT